jgi:hypothetical protein
MANALGRTLATLLYRRRQIEELGAKLAAHRAAEQELEAQILEALHAGQEVRFGARVAKLSVEQVKDRPSLRFLIEQLGDGRARAVWSALPSKNKESVVVEEPAAQEEAA